MIITTYGEGGYDPTKPNNNIIEQYDDGVPEPTETITVPISAVEQLASDMADPSINSIAEIKSSLTTFLDNLRSE